MEATLQVYSPRHNKAMYEVHLPFFSSEVDDQFWIAFCLRGGQGVNYNGVSVSDPNSLYVTKPDVNNNCILDEEHVSTQSISSPQNLEATTLSYDMVELSWEEPITMGQSPVSHYRIFVQEKDSSGSTLNLLTTNAKTTYDLKTPKAMWGKDYILTVQAIDRKGKMSPVSDPAIFSVEDQGKKKNANMTDSFSHSQLFQHVIPPNNFLPMPITTLQATEATTGHITFSWDAVIDAKDYKIRWDKGEKLKVPIFYSLAESTDQKNQFTVDKTNSGAVFR